MVGRPAGDDCNPIEAREVQAKLREVHGSFGVKATREGSLKGGGLFVDLLEHEVLVAAALHRLGRPIDLERLPPDRLSRKGRDLYRRVDYGYDFAVLYEEEPPRVAEQGLHRARQKVLALP